jgi:hypothetical protein
MRKTAFILICLFLYSLSHAQSIAWDKNFDFLPNMSVSQGISYSYKDSIIAVLSGEGFNIPNSRVSFLNSNTGDTIKTVKFHDSNFMANFSSPIKSIEDGSFIVAVSDTFSGNNSNTRQIKCRLIKFDSNLNIIWEVRLGTNFLINAPRDIYVHNNSEYYIFQDAQPVHHSGTGFGESKLSIIYYNEITQESWYRIYEFTTDGYTNAVNLLKNKSNTLTLHGRYGLVGIDRPYFIKTNLDGDTLLTKHILLDRTDVFDYGTFKPNAIVTPNNNILMAGRLDSSDAPLNPHYPFVCKVDSNYNVMWLTVINSLKNNLPGSLWQLVTQTQGDTVILISSANNLNTISLYKLNGVTGAIIDSVYLQSSVTSFTAFFTDLVHHNHDLYFSGECRVGSERQAYVGKISGVGLPATTETLNSNPTELFFIKSSISIYPNPATDVLTIETQTEGTFELYNTLGEKVHTSVMLNEVKHLQINISHLPQGTYHYQFHTKNYMQGGKIVVVK